ncbi:ANTAR domain-containing protein [Streptomyces sp. NPDC006261]|uniref:ANTAR domain-containing protein n=1 Tax=Streptomyces sp. NPDC006261 TaxID=3156739 RepID=UPI0033A9A4A3
MREKLDQAHDMRIAPSGPGAPAEPDPGPAAEIAELRSEIEGLRAALNSRPVIDIARGVLIASTPCTSRQAWEILVNASQESNVKLREIARQLVESFHGTPLPPATRRALQTAIRHVRVR